MQYWWAAAGGLWVAVAAAVVCNDQRHAWGLTACPRCKPRAIRPPPVHARLIPVTPYPPTSTHAGEEVDAARRGTAQLTGRALHSALGVRSVAAGVEKVLGMGSEELTPIFRRVGGLGGSGEWWGWGLRELLWAELQGRGRAACVYGLRSPNEQQQAHLLTAGCGWGKGMHAGRVGPACHLVRLSCQQGHVPRRPGPRCRSRPLCSR